jgi:hypothetical protein
MTESRVHRLVYLLLAVMALVAATLACSPVPQPTPTVTPSPIPPPTATPRPTETPPPSGNVTLVNQSGQTVCYVRISPSTETTWGSDWLGSDTVSAGGSYTFDVAPGTWDLRAEDCSNTVIQEDYGITITAAGYTWTVTGTGSSGPPPSTGDSPVTLLNQSGQTVCYVRMSPSTQTTWGSDWLGSDTVSAGGSYTFYVAPDTYDLRAEDCSNTVIQEDYGIAITAAGYTWTVTGTGGSVPPPSGGGNVTVVNSTSQTICYLFASLTTQSTWGDDRLGSSGTIAAGASYSFDLTPGAYDMMAMDCSQNEIERNMGVTITAAGYTWTVTGQ